jgi:adenosylhomocysteine nucleosidase
MVETAARGKVIALVGALNEEVKDIRRDLKSRKDTKSQGLFISRGIWGRQEILLVQSGMGKDAIERAARIVLEQKLDAVCSIGFAGGLAEELRVGDVVVCSAVSYDDGKEPDTLQADTSLLKLAIAPVGGQIRIQQGTVITVSHIVNKAGDKKKLRERTGASIVDMESYWLAKMAQAEQIPFINIRAISDTANTSFPDFEMLIDRHSSFQLRRALGYFIRSPQASLKLLSLYGNAQRARHNLTLFLESFISRL